MEPVEVERAAKAVSRIVGIRVAYLFGSQVRGGARADSDLDVAVVLAPGASPHDRERIRRDVVEALTEALGPLGERADVVEMDEAPTSLRFRVICEGKRLFERDRAERVRLEARIAREYADEEPLRALYRRAAVRAASALRARVGR